MFDALQAKIKVLNELIWDRRVPWNDVERWLEQFDSSDPDSPSEQIHALYLLSHFSYFNARLLRVLLQSLYRDQIQHPILQRVRKRHRDTLDWVVLKPAFDRELASIRFLGIGNPSESGTHLLYYFRQVNNLPKDLFLNAHELFEGTPLAPKFIKGVRRLIFLDDFCGSGSQATRYSKKLLARIREINKRVKLTYCPLLATTRGIKRVREKSLFTDVETVCELDDSFRAVAENSRYFREAHEGISREFAATMCKKHGERIEPANPLGFGQCQLLLAFAHNTPNNTLPIFWSEGRPAAGWASLFPRYKKGPGW